jgi:hypothetical protein
MVGSAHPTVAGNEGEAKVKEGFGGGGGLKQVLEEGDLATLRVFGVGDEATAELLVDVLQGGEGLVALAFGAAIFGGGGGSGGNGPGGGAADVSKAVVNG